MFTVHPPQEKKPELGYAVRPSGILNLREFDRYGGSCFLLFICFILSYLLFHDLLAQSVILGFLVSCLFTGLMFFLKNRIRRKLSGWNISHFYREIRRMLLARKITRFCRALEEKE